MGLTPHARQTSSHRRANEPEPRRSGCPAAPHDPRSVSRRLPYNVNSTPDSFSRPQERQGMKCTWRGVFSAAITHFRDDESLDLPATMRHLDAMIAAGIHGLIMLGTVGENCSLEYA